MHKKTKMWFGLLIVLVIIVFGVFMLVTVPEVNTVEEAREVQKNTL